MAVAVGLALEPLRELLRGAFSLHCSVFTALSELGHQRHQDDALAQSKWDYLHPPTRVAGVLDHYPCQSAPPGPSCLMISSGYR